MLSLIDTRSVTRWTLHIQNNESCHAHMLYFSFHISPWMTETPPPSTMTDILGCFAAIQYNSERSLFHHRHQRGDVLA